MKSLNIIGCGKVGKTLGRLWNEAGVFLVQDILNRSLESAQHAALFIGSGRPVASFDDLRPAHLYLIAAADDAITGCAEALAETTVVDGAIVFHLSGTLPSSVLCPVASRGASVASVHPVKSFPEPISLPQNFAGTWCGVEGDEDALTVLRDAFCAIGGRIFAIDTAAKSLYHCGSVLVCNYLNALMEAGLRAYARGGLPRETALEVMEPLVRGTLDNIFRNGPAQALTGPIARGEAGVVSRQVAALDAWDGELGRLYRVLGRLALELSLEKGLKDDGPEALLLREILADPR